MGKTSLLLKLTKKCRVRRHSDVKMDHTGKPLSTVGVDIGDFTFSPGSGKPEVTFLTWDFAGQVKNKNSRYTWLVVIILFIQEEYYATHQCFLTKRSLYLLLWNVQDGEDGLKSLQPWLENIGSCAPQSPVVVIGTHLDLLKHQNNSIQSLQEKFEEMYVNSSEGAFAYPAIHRRCYFIDVHNMKHIDQLREDIYNIAMSFTQSKQYEY